MRLSGKTSLKSDRRRLGSAGEDLACDLLKKQGLEIVERNWRCRSGEIDIVARGEGVTVFVEVKSRTSDLFGAPAEAVTPAKIARIRRLAGEYLAGARPGTDVRFDVVSVLFKPDGGHDVTHIPDAF